MGSYAVIDGKQRLTSIATFFQDKLALRGLTRLPMLSAKRYSDLPPGIRNPLGMKSLRVTTLLRQSEEELKHEVFLRLGELRLALARHAQHLPAVVAVEIVLASDGERRHFVDRSL
jgi:hypothetical protein